MRPSKLFSPGERHPPYPPLTKGGSIGKRRRVSSPPSLRGGRGGVVPDPLNDYRPSSPRPRATIPLEGLRSGGTYGAAHAAHADALRTHHAALPLPRAGPDAAGGRAFQSPRTALLGPVHRAGSGLVLPSLGAGPRAQRDALRPAHRPGSSAPRGGTPVGAGAAREPDPGTRLARRMGTRRQGQTRLAQTGRSGEPIGLATRSPRLGSWKLLRGPLHR